MRVAALFADKRGPYWGRDDVDAYDEKRDARIYQGPYSVVSHPPCQRWSRYWSGGPNPNARRRELGDDDGCFEFALHAVRKYIVTPPAFAELLIGLARLSRKGSP